MNKKNKALVFLNMGGATSKDELKMFLTNMFNDKNILTIKYSFFRQIIAGLIVKTRLNKAWKNYEKIDGKSPINELTKKLVDKCNNKLENFKVYQAMRYTPPFSNQIIDEILKYEIKDILLFPLYPQYSTTTTKSSLEDFYEHSKLADAKFNIKTVEPFYNNEKFNNCIIDEILKNTSDKTTYNLIFSAHGLPQKVINLGDPYEKQMKEHVNILSNKLKKTSRNFQSINLAYQSKVGPLKWLEPSLDNMLSNFKNENVIVYPLSFIIDNSETIFELDIEYRHIAKSFGINDYIVCKCVNDNDDFIEAINDIVKSIN